MASEIRFCSACGQPLTEGAQFCAKCGAKVGEPVQPQASDGHPRIYSVPSSGVREPSPLSAPAGYSPRSGTSPPKKQRTLLQTLGVGCLGLVGLVVVLGIIGNRAGSGALATPTAGAASASAATGAKPAATSKPEPTPLPKVGQAVTGKNWQYTVTGVDRPAKLTAIQFADSNPKGAWLVVLLSLQNIAKENYPINEHDFELRDDGGVTYKYASDFTGPRLYREERKLTHLGDRFPPGVPLKSAVVYDIAPQAKGLKLWLTQERVLVDLGQ